MSLEGVPIDLNSPDWQIQVKHNIELLWKDMQKRAGMGVSRVPFYADLDLRFKKVMGPATASPAHHATSHQNGGADEVSIAGLSGEAADPQPAKAHKTAHQNGGSDEISIAGLSGEAADPQPPKTHGNAAHSSTFATEAYADGAVSTHVGQADPHTQYQKESEKDAASGYAGLSAASRTGKGVDTTDDLIVDLATKGLVLKDTQGTPHYWRVTVSTTGVLTTTDLGTAKP